MRRFVPLALALVLLGAAPDAPPPPRGFFEESLDAEQKAEREFLALPDPAVARETMRRLAAAPHHLGSAQGAKNAEWILAKFQEWGLEARIETFDVLFPTPKERLLELVEPSTFRAVARRDGSEGRPDVRPDGRAASDLQRVLRRRRRDGAARLRQLRSSRRLRTPRAPRHRREGKDRDCPLRRRLARHQAQGRGREGSRRLHHLLRPQRRRLLRGRGLPEGRVSTRAGRAARQRRGHAHPLGRSSDAGHRRDEGRPAPRAQGRGDADEDPGASDRLRRREAAARGPRRAGRAGGLARRASAHLPDRPRPGEGAPQARVRLEDRSRAQRRGEDSRQRVARRVDRPRQSPRRLGQRRRGPDLRSRRRCSRRRGPTARCSRRAGGPSARSSSARGTARSRGSSARPSGRSITGRSSARRASPTSTPTATGAASSRPAAPTRSRPSSTGVASEVQDPEKKMAVLRRAKLRKIDTRGEARGSQEDPRAPLPRARSPRLGLGLHPVSPAHRPRVAPLRLRRRERRRDLPLHLRRLHLVHALRRHRLLVRARARANGRPDRRCAWRTPTSCRSISRRPPRRSPATSRRSPSSRTRSGRRRRSGTSAWRRTWPGPSPIRRSPSSRRSRAWFRRTSTFRRCRTRRTR